MWKIYSAKGVIFLSGSPSTRMELEPQPNEYRQEHRLGEFGNCEVLFACYWTRAKYVFKNDIYFSLIQNIIWLKPNPEEKLCVFIKLGVTFFKLNVLFPYHLLMSVSAFDHLCLWGTRDKYDNSRLKKKKNLNPQSPEGETPLDVFLLLRQVKAPKFLMKTNKVSQELKCILEWNLDVSFK